MPKKKHAYLIMAHNEPEVFKMLVSLIDDEFHDLYIHIDNKSDKQKFQDITDSFVIKSTVIFISSIDVFWGGITQVKTELNLLQAAVNSKEQYSFYHYLSGVDLPVTTNEARYTFFESNPGKEFIEIQKNPIESKWKKRAKYYWFFEQKNRILPYKLLRQFMVMFQIMIGVNRLRNSKYNLQYGSNWVSVTDKLATDILGCRNELETFFSRTHCPDEFLFQTFISSNGNYDLYQDTSGRYSNVRYIDWKNGTSTGSPSMLSQVDIQNAIKSGAMFARKFSGKEIQTLSAIEKIVKEPKISYGRV